MSTAAAGALTPDAECSGCSAPMRWVLTVGGRRMPLNPEPHPAGNVVLRDTKHGLRAEVLTGSQLPAQETAYRAHFVTCPRSSDYRRRKAITTARCRGCGHPLDPVLAASGDVYHPTCAPSDLAEHADRARRTAAASTPDDLPGQEQLTL